MPEKQLTPQERAEKFNEEYQKLVAKYACVIVAVAGLTPEGRIVAETQIRVNDERKDI